MWAESYVGLPYHEYNCAELCRLALYQDFNYILKLPQLPTKAAFMHKTILEQKELYKLTENPVDGSIVIMRMNGRMSHIGLYCKGNAGQDYVLHAMQSMHSTILTKVTQLKRLAITITEFREWR